MKRLIYALKCPVTGEIHYVGKTKLGMLRPTSHMKKSHSQKVKEWVEDLRMLGNKPDIEILEYVRPDDDLDQREIYWVKKCLNDGCLLLNEVLVKPITIRTDLQERLNGVPGDEYKAIGKFIAERRKMVGLSQKDFADKMGVGIALIRKLEQGKKDIQFSKVLHVLSAFGTTLGVIRKEIRE